MPIYLNRTCSPPLHFVSICCLSAYARVCIRYVRLICLCCYPGIICVYTNFNGNPWNCNDDNDKIKQKKRAIGAIRATTTTQMVDWNWKYPASSRYTAYHMQGVITLIYDFLIWLLSPVSVVLLPFLGLVVSFRLQLRFPFVYVTCLFTLSLKNEFVANRSWWIWHTYYSSYLFDSRNIQH